MEVLVVGEKEVLSALAIASVWDVTGFETLLAM